MGWKRINGIDYYYRSVRSGGQVRSEYFGGGETAGLIASMDAVEREEKAARRRDERAERERGEEEDRRLGEWFDGIEAATHAILTAAGYHRHNRGEWRRKRDAR